MAMSSVEVFSIGADKDYGYDSEDYILFKFNPEDIINSPRFSLTRDQIFELSNLLNDYKKTLVESSEDIEDDCTDYGC